MNPRLRAALAVLAGILVANLVFLAFEWNSAYHLPEGLDVNDVAAVNNWMNSLPASTLYRVIAGYALGALLAGWLTNRLCRPTPYRPALVTGMALFFSSFVTLATIPHPEWFMWTATLSLVLFAWLGGKLDGIFQND